MAAEGKNLLLYRIKSGRLIHIFAGDDESRIGTKVGHTKTITCLVYDQDLVFSGSVDETIISWDVVGRKIVNVFEGHEGSITAIATCQGLLASAAADVTTRLWDIASGNQLRVLYGHSKSVLSVEIGPDWLMTGSADDEARVWHVARKSSRSVRAETLRRLVGHEDPVTCVRYGKLEALTGDSAGRIYVWWMETGQIIRKCLVHHGPCKAMQFDSIHIVSGGVDKNICVTDLATGDLWPIIL